MKTSQVVLSKSDSPFLFRSIIPKDLVEYFNGRTRFHISLKNVTNKETNFVSVFLKSLVKNLYNEIRMGKNLSLEDVKEILKVEVRKSILHSHRVHLGTNKYDPEMMEDSLKSVSTREEKMNKT